MKFSFTLVLLLLTIRGFSQNLPPDSIIKLCKENLEYIDKKKQLINFYKLAEDGISIYASAKDKAIDRAEFKLYWTEVETFRTILKTLPGDSLFKEYASKGVIPYLQEKNGYYLLKRIRRERKTNDRKKLKGLRIAIDPGHIASNMAHALIEAKCLIFHKDSVSGLREDINIIEANLTIATALILKEQLEDEGAEVFLTREKPGYTASGKTLDEWFSKFAEAYIVKAWGDGQMSTAEKNRLLRSSNRTKFQDFLKTEDLKERAKKINNYNPDFTVIIHYNVDEKNTGWTKPTNKNFNMTFIPGNIKAEYMNKQVNRFELLRLIVSEDLKNSMILSHYVTKQFEEELKVPAAKIKDADYLIKESLPTPYPGVFCRNLILTRLVHGPIVYGESLYQDNLTECQLLNQKVYPIDDGFKTSPRVKQVADAYFRGILEYATAKFSE